MPSLSLKKFWYYPWDRLALFFFILTLPFSLRNVLWDFSPTSTFNEYTDISIYLSDISLFVFISLLILRNKILNKSTISSMFHVEHIFYFIPFLIWIFATILWSENQMLAIYTGVKFLEGYLLFLSLIYFKESLSENMFHVEHEKSHISDFIRKCSTWNIYQWLFGSIIISGLFQAIIAIFQFILQKSVGLHVLGESFFSKDMSGVAKVILGGEVFTRSYGLFPHPNILGGFLAFTLVISLIYPLIFQKRVFHVEHFWGITFLKISIGIQFLALLSTFSKSAIISFLIASILIFYKFRDMFHVEHDKTVNLNVPRGTFKERIKMFHVEHFIIYFSLLLLIIGIFQWINLYFWIIQPIEERLFLYSSFFSLSLREILFGLGAGQYVLLLQNFYPQILEIWQFQPVHNVFLLILGEVGLVGLGFLLFFIFPLFLSKRKSLFHVEQNRANVPRGTSLRQGLAQSLGILLLIPALTDHYWWDIQQGQLLFWVIIGVIYLVKIDNS